MRPGAILRSDRSGTPPVRWQPQRSRWGVRGLVQSIRYPGLGRANGLRETGAADQAATRRSVSRREEHHAERADYRVLAILLGEDEFERGGAAG